MAVAKPHSELVHLRDDIHDDDSDEEEQVVIDVNDDRRSTSSPQVDTPDTPPAYLNVDDSWESSGFDDSGLSTLDTVPTSYRRPYHTSFLRALCDAEDDESSSGRGTDFYTRGSSTQRTLDGEEDLESQLEVYTARLVEPHLSPPVGPGSRRLASELNRPESTTSSVSTTSSHRNSPSERLLARRQFHSSGFLKARYPTHLHQDRLATAKRQVQFRPPSCLRPASRYGKEPRVQSAHTSNSRGKPAKGPARCPQPPQDPPRGRQAAAGYRILRKMETLSVSIQCEPEKCTCSAQTEVAVRDVACQSRDVTAKDNATQTGGLCFAEQGTQCAAQMSNKLTETCVRLLFQLPVGSTEDAATQCSSPRLTADAQVQCETSLTRLRSRDSSKGDAATCDGQKEFIKEHNNLNRPEKPLSTVKEDLPVSFEESKPTLAPKIQLNQTSDI